VESRGKREIPPLPNGKFCMTCGHQLGGWEPGARKAGFPSA